MPGPLFLSCRKPAEPAAFLKGAAGTRPPGREYPQGASLLMAAKGGPVLFKISESEGFKMARSARHKRDRKRDIKRGFIPMPRKKNAQNPRERNRPYSDMDRDDRMQWWANGEPV